MCVTRVLLQGCELPVRARTLAFRPNRAGTPFDCLLRWPTRRIRKAGEIARLPVGMSHEMGPRGHEMPDDAPGDAAPDETETYARSRSPVRSHSCSVRGTGQRAGTKRGPTMQNVESGRNDRGLARNGADLLRCPLRSSVKLRARADARPMKKARPTSGRPRKLDRLDAKAGKSAGVVVDASPMRHFRPVGKPG